MAIIDAKEGAPWPSLIGSTGRPQDVQDDRNSVFIVISDKALVCVGSIRPNHSVPLEGVLSRLVVRNQDLFGWLDWN